MTELNKRHCPKGPRGPISPFLCDYCQHGKPLIEIVKPSDKDYLKVWIDKQGLLQIRVDAMGYAVYDTVLDNEGKKLRICPICGTYLPDSEEEK